MKPEHKFCSDCKHQESYPNEAHQFRCGKAKRNGASLPCHTARDTNGVCGPEARLHEHGKPERE